MKFSKINAFGCFILVLSFLASFAVQAQTPNCPNGQHWDASMNMCMPDAPPAPPVPPAPTFKALSINVFKRSCTSCHQPQSPTNPGEGGIDFSSYASLKKSNQNASNPKHAPFIIAGDADHSKLFIAVKSGEMPSTESGDPGQPLPAIYIKNIYDWINSGAHNN
jgi:hypothetical protein